MSHPDAALRPFVPGYWDALGGRESDGAGLALPLSHQMLPSKVGGLRRMLRVGGRAAAASARAAAAAAAASAAAATGAAAGAAADGAAAGAVDADAGDADANLDADADVGAGAAAASGQGGAGDAAAPHVDDDAQAAAVDELMALLGGGEADLADDARIGGRDAVPAGRDRRRGAGRDDRRLGGRDDDGAGEAAAAHGTGAVLPLHGADVFAGLAHDFVLGAASAAQLLGARNDRAPKAETKRWRKACATVAQLSARATAAATARDDGDSAHLDTAVLPFAQPVTRVSEEMAQDLAAEWDAAAASVVGVARAGGGYGAGARAGGAQRKRRRPSDEGGARGVRFSQLPDCSELY